MLHNAPLSLAIVLTLLVVGMVIERNVLPGTSREHREQAAQYGVENNLATPPRPFHFGGCTLFPDRIGDSSFLEACLTHDIAYWYGGSSSQRRHADQVFRQDIRESGSFGRWLQWPMYGAVRLFGNTWVLRQFDANWGFGYNR